MMWLGWDIPSLFLLILIFGPLIFVIYIIVSAVNSQVNKKKGNVSPSSISLKDAKFKDNLGLHGIIIGIVVLVAILLMFQLITNYFSFKG